MTVDEEAAGAVGRRLKAVSTDDYSDPSANKGHDPRNRIGGGGWKGRDSSAPWIKWSTSICMQYDLSMWFQSLNPLIIRETLYSESMGKLRGCDPPHHTNFLSFPPSFIHISFYLLITFFHFENITVKKLFSFNPLFNQKSLGGGYIQMAQQKVPTKV